MPKNTLVPTQCSQLVVNQNWDGNPLEPTSPSVGIELNSTQTALLVSRLNTPQRDALEQTINGMIIYNTTESAFQIYQADAWVTLGGGGGGVTGTGTGNALTMWTGASTVANAAVGGVNITIDSTSIPTYPGLTNVWGIMATVPTGASTQPRIFLAMPIGGIDLGGGQVTTDAGTNRAGLVVGDKNGTTLTSKNALLEVRSPAMKLVSTIAATLNEFNTTEGMIAFNTESKSLWVGQGDGTSSIWQTIATQQTAIVAEDLSTANGVMGTLYFDSSDADNPLAYCTEGGAPGTAQYTRFAKVV